MKKFLINVNGNPYEVEILGEEEVSTSGVSIETDTKTPQPSGKSIEINAPMPGNILRLEANEGDIVEAGDTLLILEAMKMENEILAPESGKVSFKVEKGATVDTGDLLVILG